MTEKYPGFFTAIFGRRKAKEPETVKKTVKHEPSPEEELRERDHPEVETRKSSDRKPVRSKKKFDQEE